MNARPLSFRVTLDLLFFEWFLVWSNEYILVEWNWAIRVNPQSSGLSPVVISVGRICCPLNVLDCRAVSLGRVLRSGLLPYPRYMSSSLSPEWFWVRVELKLKVVPIQLS